MDEVKDTRVLGIPVEYVLYVGIALIVGYMVWRYMDGSSGTKISVDEAVQMIRTGNLGEILDVRSEKEFEEGHHEMASNVPVDDIRIDHPNLRRLMADERILVYCRTGRRAKQAVKKLHNLGFTNVYFIEKDYTSLI